MTALVIAASKGNFYMQIYTVMGHLAGCILYFHIISKTVQFL